MTSQVLDLNHALRPGMRTHPGLPEPDWTPYRTRQEYQRASGTTFQLDRICMVGNTGIYLDSPSHRYADGGDLASIPLSQVVDVPVVADVRARRPVDRTELIAALGDEDIAGAAVLLHTAGDRHWSRTAMPLTRPSSPRTPLTGSRSAAPPSSGSTRSTSTPCPTPAAQ